MSKNVKIPLDIINQAIYVLEHFYRPCINEPGLCTEYENVLREFYRKKESLDLREAYANIIYAKDEDSRFLARMEYLEKKRNFKEDFPNEL